MRRWVAAGVILLVSSALAGCVADRGREPAGPSSTPTPDTGGPPKPSLVPTGVWTQTYGPYGGVVSALIVHPSDPGTLYAGTIYHDRGGGEGIFRSRDRGATWENVVPHDHAPGAAETHDEALHDLKHGEIIELAFHPTDPDVLFAAIHAKGFYRSRDGGNTWSVHNDGIQHLNVEDIAVAPSDPDVLYLATNDENLYRSTDGGTSWSRTADLDFALEQYPAPAFDPPRPKDINALAVHPSDPDVLFVGTNGGFIKTTDGGATWTRYSEGLHRTDVASVAVDPTRPDLVYLSLGEYDSIACNHARTFAEKSRDCGAVMRSTDGGQTWMDGLRGEGDTLGWVLVVDPTTPDNVYASFGHRLFQSKDRGQTWAEIFPAGHRATIADVDVYAFVVDPADPDTLFIGSRAGVYKSEDQGATWRWSNEGLIDTDIFALAVAPSDADHMYAGTKCGTGMFHSTDGGVSWDWANLRLGNQYIMDIEASPDDPKRVLVTTNMGIYHSSDAGASWRQIKNAQFGFGEGHTHLHGMAIDRTDPDTIYVGGGGDEYAPSGAGMFKSTDGGATWTKINNGFVTDVHVSSVEIDPADRNVVYAATQGPTELHAPSGPGAGIFKSIDAGTTWRSINDGLGTMDISWIALDPTDSRVVYAGTDDDGAYKSTDGGEHWREINNGLAKPLGVGQIVVDPGDPATIYLSSVDSDRLRRQRGDIPEQGVFASHDGGESWQPFNEDLENLGVYSLVFADDILYAGAKGGGVHWRTA